MPYKISESFSWLTPEAFKVESLGKNTVRVRGIALQGDAISKNQRKYVGEELNKSARTWIGKPVTINHDQRRIVGNVDWMEYEEADGTMEYLMTIKKQPYVDMLRNGDERVRGVSIEADYLWNRCSKCGERFYDIPSYKQHMKEEHMLEVSQEEPHGIKGSFLSLVVSPEEPGVPGTTLDIYETFSWLQKDGALQLLETVTNSKKQEIEWNENLKKANIVIRPESRMVYDKYLKEQQPRTDAERAKAHFNITDEEWASMSEDEKKKKIQQLPTRGSATEQDTSPNQPDLQPPAHPAPEGQPECEAGSHWDPESGTCVHDIQTDVTPGPVRTEAHPTTDFAPPESKLAKEQAKCPPGFIEDKTTGTCVAEPIAATEPPKPAPKIIPEPQITIPKADTPSPAPAVRTEPLTTVLTEQDTLQPVAPFPTEPTTDIAVTHPCPEGSHWDKLGATCVPDLLPEVNLAATPIGEVHLPKLLKLGEPFANYTDFDDCVAKNQDKDNPKAYCADIKRKVEGETLHETKQILEARDAVNIYESMVNLQKQILEYSSISLKHDTKNAEAVNQLNKAVAQFIKSTQEFLKRFQQEILHESRLRGSYDSLIWKRMKELTEYAKTIRDHINGLKLQDKGLTETANSLKEHVDTVVKQLAASDSKIVEQANQKLTELASSDTKLQEYATQKLNSLATSDVQLKEYANEKFNSLVTDNVKLHKQILDLNELHSNDVNQITELKKNITEILNEAKEQQTRIIELEKKQAKIEEYAKALDELDKQYKEFIKAKEQEDSEKLPPCPEGQHRNVEGECVADKPSEQEVATEKKLTEMATKIDNLEAKLKGQFRGNQKPLEIPKNQHFVEDPIRKYKKAN